MAESFGADPERYDRSRPRYPEAMVQAIVAASPGPVIVDVGCGTGIAARQFQAAGCEVLGVDVDERMAAFARRRGLAVEVTSFETWDPAGRVFDAVISGQTWHWVDPAAGASKASEALRPGGRLAVFWNVFQPAPKLAEAFSDVYRRVMPDALSSRPWTAGDGAYATLCERAGDGIRAARGFEDPVRWRFNWERSYTRDEWLDHVPTNGDASRFPAAKLRELLAEMAVAIDSLGGSFTMAYTALVVTAVRTGNVARPPRPA